MNTEYEKARANNKRDLTILDLRHALNFARSESAGITIEDTAIAIRLEMGADTVFLIRELQKLV